MKVPGEGWSSFLILNMFCMFDINDYLERSKAAAIPSEVIDITLAYIRYCQKENKPVDFKNIFPSREQILNSSKLLTQEKEYLVRLDGVLGEFTFIPQNYRVIYLSYAYNLLEKGCPVIFSVNNLIDFFGVSNQAIHFLSSSDKCYSTFLIPKSNGSTREINAPIPKLMWIQRWILDNILYKIPVSQFNTAFTPGASIIKNALPHVGAKVVIKMDIESFFPSISFERVLGIFLEMGYVYSVAVMLAKLSCYKGVLPQGASTSPMLANLICRNLDLRLGSLAKKRGLLYTRYADDLTFSGDITTVDGLLLTVETIVQSEGFLLSKKKTRVMRRNSSQRVTGLTVNNKPNIPREYYRKVKAIIHNCIKYGVQSQNLKRGEKIFKQHLYGHAYYILSINQKLGNNLLEQLERVNWES